MPDDKYRDNVLAFQRVFVNAGSKFTETINDVHSLIMSPLPSYSTEKSESERSADLLDMTKRIAGATAQGWWLKVQQRINMVMLSKWLTQEAALNKQKSDKSCLHY